MRAAFLNSTQSFDEAMRVERALRKGDLESLRVIGLPQTADVYDRELDAEMKGGKSDGKRNSK